MTTMLIAATVSVATNLPTVVVEASRLDRTPLEIPSTVHVIAQDEIRSSGVRDAVDLLQKKAPELHIRHLGAANPALAEISGRGYGENGHGRTLVLVDGERLNSPDLNTPNLSRIALNGVSKVEVLGGSQQVLHGDGASAGIINIITEPSDYERKSYAEIHGGSWGTIGAALGTRGGIEADGLKYWADAAWDRSDGYRSHSGYDIWNLNAGLKKEWENGTYLRVSAFYNDSQYDLPGPLSWREFKSDPRQSNATEDRYHRATYGVNTTFNAQLNEQNAIKLTGTFSNRKMWAYQQGSTGGYNWFSDNDYDIYSFRGVAEWINTTDILDFGNEFILGSQYGYDLLKGYSDSGAGGKHYDYDRQTMDFFAQDTFHFTDWIGLQFGGRYSRAWSFNELANPQRKQNHLGAFDVALISNPTDDSKIYLKGSRTYRNPFLDETPYDVRTWTPAGLLDPETGWTAELGFDWDVADEITFGADAYFAWLQDEIFYNALAGNNVNSEDDTFRRGFDVHVAWERAKLAGLSVAASYVKATFDGGKLGRNVIPLVPEMTVSVNGRVWLWDDCFVFGGFRYQGDMYCCSDFGNDYREIPWYGIFSVGATYEPTFAEWIEGFKFSVTVDNLFDKAYCDYATYGTDWYPAAGRSFMFTVRYEF